MTERRQTAEETAIPGAVIAAVAPSAGGGGADGCRGDRARNGTADGAGESSAIGTVDGAVLLAVAVDALPVRGAGSREGAGGSGGGGEGMNRGPGDRAEECAGEAVGNGSGVEKSGGAMSAASRVTIAPRRGATTRGCWSDHPSTRRQYITSERRYSASRSGLEAR